MYENYITFLATVRIEVTNSIRFVMLIRRVSAWVVGLENIRWIYLETRCKMYIFIFF